MPQIPVVLTLALIAGLATGVLVDAPLALAESVSLSASWTLALLAYRRQWPRTQMVALAAAVAISGCVLGQHALDRALHTSLRTELEQRFGGFAIEGTSDGRLTEPVVLQGRLRQDAAITHDGVTLQIDVAHLALGGGVVVARGGVSLGVGGALHNERAAEWTAGRTIRAPALLRRPARYLNEGVPDYERALARRGITLVGAIKSAALIEVVSPGRWWAEAAARIRARTRLALARHVRPRGDQSEAIAAAILIGDRAGLDLAVERRLQEAGTYHVIAISGGNIAIFAALALGALASVGARGRLAALAAIAALAAYAAIADAGPSVGRATLMAIGYLAVSLLDHRTSPANALALTATVLLLTTPLAISDIGFWMTFGATAAIVIAARRVVSPAGVIRRAFTAVLVASCAVELALVPVTAAVFQRVTFAGLILNFIALPAMTTVQLGAMAVVTFDVAGLMQWAAVTGAVVHAAAAALTESAALVDYAPWLTWRVPSPRVGVILVYYTAAALALLRTSSASGRAAAWLAGALFLWIVTAPEARVRAAGDGQLHLTMLDVGQGDAMLVVFPNGRRMVLDTGGGSPRGSFDIGDRVIGPALRARRITSLDYLAVTHGDPDHIGGAPTLVRELAPAEIWWGVPVDRHEPAAAVQAEARRVRAGWRTLQRGDRIEIGGVELRVHHPPPPDWDRQRVRNDDSLVIELRFGRVSMLLTGDIGKAVEQELVPALDLLPVVVLKVAHHGSGTSSAEAFVQRIRPAVALIGTGRGNPYGHPVPYVLERLRQASADVFRTDLDGQIDVSTDGRAVSVTTFTGRRMRLDPQDGPLPIATALPDRPPRASADRRPPRVPAAP